MFTSVSGRSALSILSLLMLFSGHARADELADLQARNAQLEATVEELTLRLADAIKARKELEAALVDAKAEASAASAAAASAAAAGTTMIASEPVAAQAPSAPASTMADTRTAESEPVIEDVAMIEATTVAAASAASETRASTNPDCDVADALMGYERSGNANKALSAWLRSSNHLKACSSDELRTIRDAVKWDLLGYQKEVLGLIDQELAAR